MKLEHDWLDAEVPANVVLGERTWLYSAFAFLHHGARRPVALRVGRDCGIYQGTCFELGPDAEVELGDFSTLAGPLLATNGRVVIGSHALLSYGVTIADSPWMVPPDGDAPPAPGPTTRIGDNVWCGTRAFILGGVTIGDHAVIGARAVVTEDVPARAIVAGSPARVVGEVP